MRWQRVAQAAIALLVIGFVVVLVTTLRRPRVAPAAQPAAPRQAESAPFENTGGGTQEVLDPSGRKQWGVKFGTHVVLADGRQELRGGVDLTINRPDREINVTAREADITPADDGSLKTAVFRGDVHVTGSGSLDVKAAEATYTQADGMLTIPGPVEFTKGRMKGAGTGATYDQTREVFWIREQARVNVAPGAGGDGALEASAGAIGMARMEHYILLQGSARISGGGRLAEATDITVRLSADDERVQALELRGGSRITGGATGPQAMSARDIDVTYAEDGRTMQHAKLIERAVVDLPGAGGGKRVAGNTIDIGLGPDGSTVTSLTASDRVQVDLPADGASPAKTIRSSTLSAAGLPGTGLQNATFGGGVEYRETRPARRNAVALDRTVRSVALVVDTKPGLGSIEKADFRGNVKFIDAPEFTADAQQGIYHVAQDRLELMPAEGQPGPPSPAVTDGKVSVAARTIQFSLATREMAAETKVRSTIQPERNRQGRGGQAARLPSLLADDEPVNVTSNRLAYKGTGSAAVYSGNVTLWQGADTTIKAATISIDDKTGNLAASGNAATTFAFQETNRKTGEKTRQPTIGNADTFTYDDGRRLATYTGHAHMQGLQGDVTGEKIELYMKAGANELERAEAYGANGSVQVREGNRIAKGAHLTYTAADDRYLMIGTPVDVVENKNGTCTLTLGATVTFNRATESARVDGSASGGIPMKSETLKACPAPLAR